MALETLASLDFTTNSISSVLWLYVLFIGCKYVCVRVTGLYIAGGSHAICISRCAVLTLSVSSSVTVLLGHLALMK